MPDHSPYSLTEINAGVYTFVNVQDIGFKLAFQVAVPDDGFADNPEILQKLLILTFRPFPKVANSLIDDPRIGHTICHYIQKALDNGFIINYLCSDEGDLGRTRRIIFGFWYRDFYLKEYYQKIDYTLEEPNGKLTYLGFIIKKDNVLYKNFIAAVGSEIEVYQAMKDEDE